MKKVLSSIPFFLFTIFLCYIYVGTPTFEEARCQYLKEFKEMKFNGVVVAKYIDSSQHSYPIVEIKDQDSIARLNLSYDTTNLYQLLQLNDSIKKKKNSSSILVKGKTHFKWIDVNYGCKSKK